MKNHVIVKTILLPLSLLLFSCNEPMEQVVFTRFETPVESIEILTSFDAFETLIDQEKTFLLTVTNNTCTCTSDFMPLYEQYLIGNDIVGYAIEYHYVLYEPEKHGLPVFDANSPILTIFDAGVMKYYRSYKIGDGTYNKTFTDYDSLSQYLEDRIDVIDA